MEHLKDKYLRYRPVIAEPEIDAERLSEDLARYLALAGELGVSAAAIVDHESWYLDPRVTLKCAVPRCRNYSTCANCPPHTPGAAETAVIIAGYRKGILLRWQYSQEYSGPERAELKHAMYTTLAAIESAAFYDGYYLACGFGSGSCRLSLCENGVCQEITEPHKGCRHPFLARPSMEAMGFDVYKTAARAGWLLHPAGRGCPEEIAASRSRIAIVLIA